MRTDPLNPEIKAPSIGVVPGLTYRFDKLKGDVVELPELAISSAKSVVSFALRPFRTKNESTGDVETGVDADVYVDGKLYIQAEGKMPGGELLLHDNSRLFASADDIKRLRELDEIAKERELDYIEKFQHKQLKRLLHVEELVVFCGFVVGASTVVAIRVATGDRSKKD